MQRLFILLVLSTLAGSVSVASIAAIIDARVGITRTSDEIARKLLRTMKKEKTH